MGNIFSGSEIVEIGVQIEKNGKAFYDEATAKSKHAKAKEIFQYLAEEEAKHISVFHTILDSVQKYEPKEAYPSEYFSYMNSLASEHIVTQENKGKEIASSAKTDLEVLELGIKFEEDSIVFYEGMKKVVPEHDQGIVNDIINQEQTHLSKLLELKKEL